MLERLLLPPGGPLLLVVLGWLLARGGESVRRRAGRALAALGVVLLYLASTPAVSLRLLAALERGAPWDPDLDGLQALVVLGGDVAGPSPEAGGITVGPLSLERARWAARVQRRTGLPLLVCGGPVRPATPPVAELLRVVLEQDFDVPVSWVEARSSDTAENAARAAEILRAEGSQRIGLITHAFHVPRAARHFRAQGLAVVPLPTAFHGPAPPLPQGLLPSARALRDGALACHELAGLLWDEFGKGR